MIRDEKLQEVLTIITDDKITQTATQDETILALGEEVLRRNIDNEAKRHYYASQRMRDAARLLIKVQELSPDENITSMAALLRPSLFDNVVEAALQNSLLKCDDDDDLRRPSYAIKMKYSLIRKLSKNWTNREMIDGEEYAVNEVIELEGDKGTCVIVVETHEILETRGKVRLFLFQ